MYKNGFIKVLASTPKIIAGDIKNNEQEIIKTLNMTEASLVVFPELAITGYTIGDLLFQDATLKASLLALSNILKENEHNGLAAIGMPLEVNNVLFNVAVVIKKDKILGVIPKYYLPNHSEFSEKRYFADGLSANINEVIVLGEKVPFGKLIFRDLDKDILVGVEVCQDMWTVNAPSNLLALSGANVILNLSASPETVGKEQIRRNAVLDLSRRQMASYVYTTTGMYESSSETIFSSHKIIASMGNLIAESEVINFEEDQIIADINITAINHKRRLDSNFRDNVFKVKGEVTFIDITLDETRDYIFDTLPNKYPFVPNDYELGKIYKMLTASLIKKLSSLPISNRKIIIGLSGGLDSTHALIIAYNAFIKMNLPLKDLIVVAMPTKVSSKGSLKDALELTSKLGLKLEEINIDASVKSHLKDINHDLVDTTYENAQARIRTLILMDLANKYQGIVLGTGDLSEIALGFMTYNGDQMSMYAINAGVPKTLMQKLVIYYADNIYHDLKDVLYKIVNKKISPELLENQNTEDIIGSYLINDFIMYYHLSEGLDDAKLIWLIEKVFELSHKEAETYVKRFVGRFYSQQFKRTTLPEGPKVFSLGLSPRNSYKLPSDIIRKW